MPQSDEGKGYIIKACLIVTFAHSLFDADLRIVTVDLLIRHRLLSLKCQVPSDKDAISVPFG